LQTNVVAGCHTTRTTEAIYGIYVVTQE